MEPIAQSPVNLREFWPTAQFLHADDLRIARVVCDSRDCSPQTLFAVIPGSSADGRRFIDDAISRGATSLLAEAPIPDIPIPQCIVPNVRRAFAELAARLAGSPARKLRIAGVTGTNGKTTVAWLIRWLLESRGNRTGLLGTILNHDGLKSELAQLTTPSAIGVNHWFGRMVSNSATHCAMELSSHALDQDRIAGTPLAAAVVTNVTQDHFDYHRDFNTYWTAKSRIAEYLAPGGLLVLNADDHGSAAMEKLAGSEHQVVRFGITQPAECNATVASASPSGSWFQLQLGQFRQRCTTPLVGVHNVSNCLAAAAVAVHFGMSLPEIADGLASFPGVPGRLERITMDEPFAVYVDYAHTEDALQRVLASLRSLTPGKLICVFGAGGNRDRDKRPKLGRAASLADIAIVTSDNPRHESPLAIINQILPGLKEASSTVHVESDRRAAIQWAIQLAGPGDCVLIAGKGHETEQIIGNERLHFDDREIARAALKQTVPGFTSFCIHPHKASA